MKRIEDWQIKYVEKKKRTFENGLLLKMEQEMCIRDSIRTVQKICYNAHAL